MNKLMRTLVTWWLASVLIAVLMAIGVQVFFSQYNPQGGLRTPEEKGRYIRRSVPPGPRY